MLQKLDGRNPGSIVQGCYVVTRRATRRVQRAVAYLSFTIDLTSVMVVTVFKQSSTIWTMSRPIIVKPVH